MARHAHLTLFFLAIGVVAVTAAQLPPRPNRVPVPPSLPQDLSGTYAVTGTSPQGEYTATAAMLPHGPVYEVQWTFPQGDGMTGVGFVHDGVLVVGFATESTFGISAGVVAYRVVQDRPLTLEGTWTGWGHTTLSTERLVKGPPAIRAGP